MRILISNDDGIYSPGIAAAARAASKFGDVRIVAPDVEQSSMGHAITANRPLSYRKTVAARRVRGLPRQRHARRLRRTRRTTTGSTSTWSCPASTSGPTSATRCGTPARWRPPSRRRC